MESTSLPNDCVIYITNTLAETVPTLFPLLNFYICYIFFIFEWTQTFVLHLLNQYTLMPVADLKETLDGTLDIPLVHFVAISVFSGAPLPTVQMFLAFIL